MTKQKAIRLQTTNCNVFLKAEHVRLIGGHMDGWQMLISNAKAVYNFDLDIDETKLCQITGGKLHLIDVTPETMETKNG